MAEEVFYPTNEAFTNATHANGHGKKDLACPSCKKGVLWTVAQAGIRSGMNQRTYECDKCHSKHIVQS